MKNGWISSSRYQDVSHPRGHGHQDVVNLTDPTLVMKRDSGNVRTTAKLFIYNVIDGENMDSFHFYVLLENSD